MYVKLNHSVIGISSSLSQSDPIKWRPLYIWVELLIWGVRKGDKILIWGYAEDYNPDLGVREYQKVENSCSSSFTYCNHSYNK
jgi:hypothetical protein